MIKITFPDGSVTRIRQRDYCLPDRREHQPSFSCRLSCRFGKRRDGRHDAPDRGGRLGQILQMGRRRGQARLLAHLVAPAGRSPRSPLSGHQVRHRPRHRKRLLLRRRFAHADHRGRPSEDRTEDAGAVPQQGAARPPRGPQGRSAEDLHREGRRSTRSNRSRTCRTEPSHSIPTVRSPTSAGVRTSPTRVTSRPSS